MNFVRLLLLFCVGLAVSSCRKESQNASAPPVKGAVSAAKAEATKGQAIVDTLVIPAPELLPVAPQVPFRVCALLGTPDAPRAGLSDNATGEGVTLRKGESHLGFVLQGVDFQREAAVFNKEGRTVSVFISKGQSTIPAVPGGAKPGEGGGALQRDQPANLTQSNPQRYEQTEAERRAGIDPNDPATWPAGYRGPGIERAMGENPALKSADSAVQLRPGTNVWAPTSDETAAGINPNEPATWPAGYRGPGIERAMKAHPNAGNPAGPSLQARPEDAPQSQGLGPGIEEALRRQNSDQ